MIASDIQPRHFDAPAPHCLGCGAPLTQTFVDLGDQPLANSYLPIDALPETENFYPLHARVCHRCLLVQVDNVTPADAIFNENYAYFSSFSSSWLDHCRRYVAAMTERFGLGADSQVVEIASNDGYMLQYFVERGIPVRGIEPSGNVAAAAREKGIATEVAFFGRETAARLAGEGLRADLIAAKNVMAHVPDINDFVAGIPLLLNDKGVFTVEFPHLLNLIRENQFDTIYHEHFTYLSLLAVETVFARHGLAVFDVEEVPTHGGSLRVFAARAGERTEQPGVQKVRDDELAAQLDRPEGYAGYDARVRAVRDGLLAFLAQAKQEGRIVAAYGAAAKGNTLLNYCGVTSDDIAFAVDRNPAKQDTLLPGSHIPVRDPAALEEDRPDYLLILPWNLTAEISAQNVDFAARGGRFVVAIPELRIF